MSVHGICHEFLTTHLGHFNVGGALFDHSEAQGSWKSKKRFSNHEYEGVKNLNSHTKLG